MAYFLAVVDMARGNRLVLGVAGRRQMRLVVCRPAIRANDAAIVAVDGVARGRKRRGEVWCLSRRRV